jgi:ubiquinone/menaquinone biosynthesis C-methylase UbiE
VADVASGKGEAACTIAEKLGCTAVALDPFLPFLRHSHDKARTRGLPVRHLRASGRKLPLADGSCDGGLCIGAPSIVGLEPGLSELSRVVRPGGVVVVSDVVFRALPGQPSGPEWGWLAEIEQFSAGEYAQIMERCGLQVERAHVHDRAAWEAYHAPMLEVAAEARAQGDAAFAARAEEGVDLERRGVDEWIDYATFISRRA